MDVSKLIGKQNSGEFSKEIEGNFKNILGNTTDENSIFKVEFQKIGQFCPVNASTFNLLLFFKPISFDLWPYLGLFCDSHTTFKDLMRPWKYPLLHTVAMCFESIGKMLSV